MKIASIMGARPQCIKYAMLARALDRKCQHSLIHTGQHHDYEMYGVFFDQQGLTAPAYDLGINGNDNLHQLARLFVHLPYVLREMKPDMVIVYGDTNATLAGAMCAAELGIPLAHVEAGCRSGNLDMTEERTRIIADNLSTFLLCPTQTSVTNLNKEGHRHGVHLVGDVMLDAMQANLEHARALPPQVDKAPYALATLHRAENVDDPLRLKAIIEALGKLPVSIVIPLHPRTKARLHEFSIKQPDNFTIMKPQAYIEMLRLMMDADCILTDSGGVQKEAFWLGVRCITLRNETEWPETVAAGWNRLAGSPPLSLPDLYDWQSEDSRYSVFGDGHAAEKIAEILLG